MSHLLYKREGSVATLTLNRPERRNAFSDQMISEWEEAIIEAGRDDQVRVMVLTGEGTSFCAGGALPDIIEWRKHPDPVTRKNFLWRGIHRVPFAMANMEKPTIAAINGPAIGAGCDMALMCDIRIASDKAVLGETYLLAGLVPGDGGAWLLPRLVGVAKACELLLTGEVLSAAEAERIGLVNRVVPHEELLAKTYAMAERIASLSPTAVQMTKRMIYQGLTSDFKSALDLASSLFAHILPSEETGRALQSIMDRTRTKREK